MQSPPPAEETVMNPLYVRRQHKSMTRVLRRASVGADNSPFASPAGSSPPFSPVAALSPPLFGLDSPGGTPGSGKTRIIKEGWLLKQGICW